ncbi:MAG: hypothetical protein QN141_04325 [Armatimonadota bacterium]|nr:hypothetical protein [Armatimonadota bacterium]MDR7450590.1 hypothetical protein [Armatimonadota bacterium]MDR7466277.1 hypothetical protein [Armatimonadota bacterium]MDR7492998.1 hypothetical protein [Armatimonadota bacterium]MDR7498245.1 hypothetical protein [Armatimonadota bacterium]
MPDTIRLVDYYYVMTADRPGEGARVLGHLKDAGVNLLAFHAFPSGRRAQLNLVPSDAAALRAAARKAKWKLVGPKKAFLLTGDDRTGALVDHYNKLAQAKINVVATDAVAVSGYYGAILWVGPRDVKKAAQILGAV